MAKDKDYNKQLNDNKDLPKIVVLVEAEAIKRYGGDKMLIAPPLFYDKVMKEIPYGKVITTSEIREKLAKEYHADFTCPLTAGIFIGIVAKASEHREDNKTPYWRTLKANGELNSKYPGGIESQKAKLAEEGYTFVEKGKKNIRYFVKDYQEYLYAL